MHKNMHILKICTKWCIKDMDSGEFMSKNEIYVAIIGDIKRSKTLEERKIVQIRMKNVLQNVNAKYKKEITAKFTITLGDEFQGLLQYGNCVLDVVEYIRREMYPVEIRFGIGIGEITTDIDSQKAIGADGPAYYMARDAIEKVKQSERQKKKIQTSTGIRIDFGEKQIENLLNASMAMLELIQRKWTARQREVIMDYDYYQDSQEKSAKRLGITQSTVQRCLVSGNYYQYKNTKEAVKEMLEEIMKRYV